MSWQFSARSLLRDLKRSKTSTPSELQLQQLHIEVYENEKQIAWDNIESVADIIGGEEGRSSTSHLILTFRHINGVQFCSKFVFGLLLHWINALSVQATVEIDIDRRCQLRLKNDTYSLGVSANLMMTLSSADAVTAFPHNISKAIPFSAVLMRERCRPDPLLTTAELYSVLAMAAKHHMLFDMKSINFRLLIVYSHWVQVLNVTTTVPYIKSIVDGEVAIADKLTIHQSSWFNFLDASGQLETLLLIFEGIELEPLRGQLPLQERKFWDVLDERLKRSLAGEKELRNHKSKSQRVSYKQASRGSQDVS